ncbi:MAG: hypothetical protein M1827_001601 [Pycnora praestabilis]|nr:MAG: hypothetical protein M1827_001601 [Pycnora praestabilis]
MTEKAQSSMNHISPSSLNNLPDRVRYLKSFLSFTQTDGESIQSSKPLIAPLLPTILDAVYTTLLSYDITAKAFVPRQPGHTGPVPLNAEDLALDHPQILRRKDFLKQYLVRLVSNDDWSDNSGFWTYLDRVGIMHTGQPGFKHRQNRPDLRVEYVHMGLLLGFVEDVVAQSVLETDELDAGTKANVLRAFNKLLWIQNDLFARHYVIDRDSDFAPQGVQVAKAGLTRENTMQFFIVAVLGTFLGIFVSRLFLC